MRPARVGVLGASPQKGTRMRNPSGEPWEYIKLRGVVYCRGEESYGAQAGNCAGPWNDRDFVRWDDCWYFSALGHRSIRVPDGAWVGVVNSSGVTESWYTHPGPVPSAAGGEESQSGGGSDNTGDDQ